MPRYKESEYSLENALMNIGEYFWTCYQDSLLSYAQDPAKTEIIDTIHKEWDRDGMSPFGTDIRIEWAVAIYQHGDWEKALTAQVPNYQTVSTPALTDPRKKFPADFRCDNGIYVRSLSELFIANWLYANKIPFEYEREIHFASCQRNVHCDFYLPEHDVYIEYWGMEKDEKYIAYKEWKAPLYKRNGYKLVSLTFQDLKLFRDSFRKKLQAALSSK